MTLLVLVSEVSGQSFDPSEFPVLSARVHQESGLTGPARPGYGMLM